jgi:hypothetical protein
MIKKGEPMFKLMIEHPVKTILFMIVGGESIATVARAIRGTDVEYETRGIKMLGRAIQHAEKKPKSRKKSKK